MKRAILFLTVICLLIANHSVAQKSGLLKKVTNSMTNELLGKTDDTSAKENQQPEPACACDQPQLIMSMDGKLQLDYRELSISILDDGRLLAKHVGTGEYYIVKEGVTQGPYKSGDPQIAEFEAINKDDGSVESFLLKNKSYISRSGEKFLITFDGKKYGPYAQINNFTVTKSKDKFAAMVIENIVVNEDQGKKMDEAIKNAKTEQERMELAMQFSQQIQQKMMDGGGPASSTPKLVTNIPDATVDQLTTMGGTLNGNMKYDDILILAYDKILDLKGNTVIKIKPELSGYSEIYVNSLNTVYAVSNYGTLTFSDNKSLSEVFNTRLIKVDGKIYLAYMYYSPKKNSIMQCKIMF